MKFSGDNRADCRLLVLAAGDRRHGLVPSAQAEAIRRLLRYTREDEVEDGKERPR